MWCDSEFVVNAARSVTCCLTATKFDVGGSQGGCGSMWSDEGVRYEKQVRHVAR